MAAKGKANEPFCLSLLLFDTKGNFLYSGTYAGVVKLVDARDSKSRGASTPCRFDSDLRHQKIKGLAKLRLIPFLFGFP